MLLSQEADAALKEARSALLESERVASMHEKAANDAARELEEGRAQFEHTERLVAGAQVGAPPSPCACFGVHPRIVVPSSSLVSLVLT